MVVVVGHTRLRDLCRDVCETDEFLPGVSQLTTDIDKYGYGPRPSQDPTSWRARLQLAYERMWSTDHLLYGCHGLTMDILNKFLSASSKFI